MRKEASLPSSTVRFLHSVGQSTLRQGITVPLSAQVSWLANIKKGESAPVTIVFDKNRSVPASLRRLNNLLGHLQFRYESRQQAPLRDYLHAVFGEKADCKNAILRIVELESHVFLFQPVSAGYEKVPFLSLYKPHFHNFSEGDARRIAEFTELQQCFASIPYDDGYNQFEYNARIARTLRDVGWRTEVRILKEIGLRCDFEKNGVWLEVEFGNARAYYQDYVKFLLALRYANARLGVLLCPTNAFAQLLCDLGQKRAAAKKGSEIARLPSYSGMMSYEKAIRELPFLQFILTGSVIIGGIEIQG
jgi:hypothetical protein